MNSEKLTITIEKMTSKDVDEIFKIEEETYGAHHWSKDSFYSEVSNNIARYYIARTEDGTAVGYIGSWFIIEEAHITNVSVSPKYRRNSIGEALLYHVIKQCYEEMVKYITLEVRVSNDPAINLYKKYTFSSLGCRKKYYQDNNEDALIMWTENIFWDKFKLKFLENEKELNSRINIL